MTGLAALSNGFLSTVAEDAVVRRHRADGTVEERWGLPGDGPVPAWPTGLAVDPGGQTWVVDRHGGR